MTEPTYTRTYEFLKWTRIPLLDRPFVTPLTVSPRTKYLSYNPTWEDTGEHWGPTVVARIPFTRLAIGFGVWLNAPHEIIPIHDMDAAYDEYVVVNGHVDRGEWERARQYIASKGLDPSEEMEMMQSLGIFS